MIGEPKPSAVHRREADVAERVDGTLPPELVREGVRRLRRLLLPVAVVMLATFGTAFCTTTRSGYAPGPLALWSAAARLVVVLAMFVLTRREDAEPADILDRAAGVPMPPPLWLLGLFLPTFLSAAMALIGARVIYGLSRDVAAAREMGAYRLLSPLGRGGMGEVWCAEHRLFARPAAVKLIRAGGGDGADRGLTVPGALAGSPATIPPEVARGRKEIDSRADLYSLGCVGYWLLTGTHVFPQSTAMAMIHDHAATPPVPPSRRTDRAVPDELEGLLMQCLEKDPARRPESARALAQRLEAIRFERPWTEERAEAWWTSRAAYEAQATEVRLKAV